MNKNSCSGARNTLPVRAAFRVCCVRRRHRHQPAHSSGCGTNSRLSSPACTPQSCRPHGMQKRCYCREVSAGRSCDRPPRREAQLFEDPFGQLSAGLAARLGGRVYSDGWMHHADSTKNSQADSPSLATAGCRRRQPQTRRWRKWCWWCARLAAPPQ